MRNVSPLESRSHRTLDMMGPSLYVDALSFKIGCFTLMRLRTYRHTSLVLFFFFSSRRRHTRFDCDWSSDVCSSDLIVGGLVDHYFGWRQAFFVAGVPGLVLAALAVRLYDPPRGAQDSAGGVTPGARAAYAALVRNRPYVLTVLGYAAYTFAIGALAFWTPAFLE